MGRNISGKISRTISKFRHLPALLKPVVLYGATAPALGETVFT